MASVVVAFVHSSLARQGIGQELRRLERKLASQRALSIAGQAGCKIVVGQHPNRSGPVGDRASLISALVEHHHPRRLLEEYVVRRSAANAVGSPVGVWI